MYASKDTINPIPICAVCHMVTLKDFIVLQIKIVWGIQHSAWIIHEISLFIH